MAESKETAKQQTPAAIVAQPPVQQFEPAYDMEATREAEAETTELSPSLRAIAESGITFNNSPQQNDQWIGYVEEDGIKGVNTGTIRRVPLGPEALSAGRKVVFKSGAVAMLPATVNTLEALANFTHPETGEQLIEGVEYEAPEADSVAMGAGTTTTAGSAKRSSSKSKK